MLEYVHSLDDHMLADIGLHPDAGSGVRCRAARGRTEREHRRWYRMTSVAIAQFKKKTSPAGYDNPAGLAALHRSDPMVTLSGKPSLSSLAGRGHLGF